MKQSARIVLLSLFVVVATSACPAQSLIVTMTEQLAKLELYLHETEQGYAIFQKGLSAIGDIKNGDFHLHQLFFGSLETVSPSVKRYTKVADLLTLQLRIVAGCAAGIRQFVQGGSFSSTGRQYVQAVYQHLQQLTDNDTDELTDLLTDGRLHMSDDERLHRIDQLYATAQDKDAFLTVFSIRAAAMQLNAAREKQDLQYLQKIVQP
jgi:hypothetical protein